jgi:hypothetical protein
MKQATKLLLALGFTSALAVMTAAGQVMLSNTFWNLPETGFATMSAYLPDSGSYGGVASGNIVGYDFGTLQTDPISGLTTLHYGLFYDMMGKQPALTVAGDVLLLEASGVPSDLLRFDGVGGVFFFSDLEPNEPNPDMADVGIPQWFNPVVLNELGSEGDNGALYTPAAGQPGFDLSGQFPDSQYLILSDVPEPTSALLLFAGAALWRFQSGGRKSRS